MNLKKLLQRFLFVTTALVTKKTVLTLKRSYPEMPCSQNAVLGSQLPCPYMKSVLTTRSICTCRRSLLTTRLAHQQKGLDRSRALPDPRDKKPKLEEQIGKCSKEILKLVRDLTLLHLCAFVMS